MKNINEIGLFDMEERLLKLSNGKDPLIRLKSLVNREQFRPILAELRKEP